MVWALSKRSQQHRKGVRPELVGISDLALSICPIDFGYPEYAGLRTAEEQHCLYLDKKSKCDGYKHTSDHQTGNALDFYAYVDGKASWDEHHLAVVAAAHMQAAMMLGHRIEWGGLWKGFKDYPHIRFIS